MLQKDLFMSENHSAVICYHCNKDSGLLNGQNISFKEECPHCASDLHVCKMCHFYDTTSYNHCKEPLADRIVEKEKNNYCDFFILGLKNSDQSNSESALDAALKLFKN